jgi:HEAT repeat protein
MALSLECEPGPVDDGRSRAEAALALSRIGSPLPFEILEETIRASADDETELAVRTIMAIAERRDASSESTLLGLLENGRHPMVIRSVAAAGIGVLGEATPRTRKVLMDVARSMAHDDLRIACSFALGALGDRESVTFLLDRLEHDESPIRQAFLLTALARSNDLRVTDVLLAKTRDRNLHIRFAATAGLGRLLDGSGRLTGMRAEDSSHPATELRERRALASRHLREIASKGGDERVRALAAIALGRIRGEENDAFLIEVARTTNGHLRGSVMIALALSGADDGEAEMTRLLLDKNEVDSTRACAALALGLRGEAGGTARRVLRSSLGRSHSDVVRRYSAIALGMLSDVPSIETLTGILESKRSSAWLRHGVARGLALLGTPAAEQAIIEAVERETEPAIATAILRTLGASGGRRADEYLTSIVRREAITDKGAVAMHVLGHRRGTDRPPVFARFLEGWDYFIRVKSFDVLHDFI